MSDVDRSGPTSDLEKFRKLKTLAIQGLVSDDELMEVFLLKGGNALDIIHNMGGRASFDLDFSMADEFPAERLEELVQKIDAGLTKVFYPAGYQIFDVELHEKPKHLTPDMAPFWGGYGL